MGGLVITRLVSNICISEPFGLPSESKTRQVWPFLVWDKEGCTLNQHIMNDPSEVEATEGKWS